MGRHTSTPEREPLHAALFPYAGPPMSIPTPVYPPPPQTYMNRTLLFACLAATVLACRHETLDEKICRQTRDFTQQSCPRPMDPYTVLDSMVYVPGTRTMSYHYSMSGKMDTSSVYNEAMKDMFYTDLLDNIRQNPGLNELKEHGVTFRYVYSSGKDASTEYMSFTYPPADYTTRRR